MSSNEEALEPMVTLVSEMVHHAITEGIRRTEDPTDPNAVMHSVWESTTEGVVMLMLRVRDSVLNGLHERLDSEAGSALEMYAPAVAGGLASPEWVNGYADGLGRAATLTRAITEVEVPDEFDAATMLAGLPDLLGPIPRQVLTWLTVIAIGATPDPVGWLRMQLKELEA